MLTPPKFRLQVFPVSPGMEYHVSAIMKKLKNGCHFVTMCSTEKIQITNTPQSLGIWFSGCQQKWNISIGHYGKIEKWWPFVNVHCIEKFQIANHPKLLVSGLPHYNFWCSKSWPLKYFVDGIYFLCWKFCE